MADDVDRNARRKNLHSKRHTVSSTIADKSRELIGNGRDIANCVSKGS